VSRYRLTTLAKLDIVRILHYLLENAGSSIALKTESDTRAAFRSLAEHPGLGHHREDLTSHNVLFFLVRPYFIIYRVEDEGLVIHAVIHSARDMKAILRLRPV
jgi:plasmid stabilization system protein ParE